MAGCAGTKYASKTTHPDGTVTEWGGTLRGQYGLIPTEQERGNTGGNSGGLLGRLLPSFNHSDTYTKSYVEAQQDSYISIGPDGLVIRGPVDHATNQEIQSNGINRGIRNVATYGGWKSTMDTAGRVLGGEQITERLRVKGANDQALKALDNKALETKAATDISLQQIQQ